jgi:exosortase B
VSGSLINSQGKNEQPSRAELALLAVALLVMYVPTFIALDKKIWSIVGQGHGPVMLALTIWLVWQRAPKMATIGVNRNAKALFLGLMLLFAALTMYVLGRSQGHFGLDVGSLLIAATALILIYYGKAGLVVMWFPLLFAITLVPLPSSMVEALTGPLKSGVSYVAEAIMYSLGYPIGRSGVTLSIGPYKLLVADACAGLNSIFALEAISIFYMSVVGHASNIRNILLALLVLPISFVSNVLRVISLVLVTYYFGDEVGQGFVHGFAGIFLFMIATALTIFVDGVLGLFMKSKAPSPR